jgi:hypothetical protein
VCSFEGFQFGTRRAISAPEPEDPDREVAQPLRGIGGLHQNLFHWRNIIIVFLRCSVQVTKINIESNFIAFLPYMD